MKKINIKKIIFTFFIVGLITLINLFINQFLDYRSLGMIYLLGLTLSALYTSGFSLILGSLLSTFLWNFLFIPPQFTLHAYSKEDFLMLSLFLASTLVLERFTRLLKIKEDEIAKNKLVIESQKIMESILSSVSHEIRTPLSAIKGFASALKLKNKNEEFYNEVGNEIVDATERLDQVVQNLLDMSRINSGYFQLKKQIIDLRELISTAIIKNKKRFPNREIEMSFLDNETLIEGDFVLLEQVLENILRNACIYSKDKIKIDIELFNEKLLISISDQGPGFFDPTKVFEKFYRENPQTPGGLGLGLSISKYFIELHNGSIEATNLLPRGAKMNILLPRINHESSV